MHREKGLNPIKQPLPIFPHALLKSLIDLLRHFRQHHGIGRPRDVQRVKQGELLCPGKVFQGMNGLVGIIRSVNRE